MDTETNLGRKIDQIDKNAQYDACAKRLLSEKVVLAYILKHSVPEFADCRIEDIRDKYIEGVEVAARGVDVDEANTQIIQVDRGSAIRGENVESNTKTEGKITYDIIFRAICPGTKESIRLIINVEAQKADPKSYEIVTRGFYYCGRMLSSEKGSVFSGSDYQKIQKVYSVWICMNPQAERRNTMNVYSTEEHTVIGSYKGSKKSYDLMTVMVMNLGMEKEEGTSILDFLNTLLSDRKEPEQKKKELLEKYHIDTTAGMRKEMQEMCNLSYGIAEEAMEKGIKIGKAEGRAEGREEGRAEGIVSVLKSQGASYEDTVATIKKILSLTQEDASTITKKYWKM